MGDEENLPDKKERTFIRRSGAWSRTYPEPGTATAPALMSPVLCSLYCPEGVFCVPKTDRFRYSYKMEHLKAIELPILRASRKLGCRFWAFSETGGMKKAGAELGRVAI
jgi:hypothetical protein